MPNPNTVRAALKDQSVAEALRILRECQDATQSHFEAMTSDDPLRWVGDVAEGLSITESKLAEVIRLLQDKNTGVPNG